MSQFFNVHPTHPQARLIRQAAEIVREGGLIAYPTDSCYALGCHIGDKAAMDRLRRVRGMDDKHHLTLMCRDLSEISAYAMVDNAQYRLLKAATPGSYTFILRATREVPRRLMHPRRKTIGVRVPQHPVAHALLAELNEPMLSATLQMPGEDAPLSEAADIRARFERDLDLILGAGHCGIVPSTVVDLTGEAPVVLRIGTGSVEALGLETVA
jgi:tRNA threonylcarbamoyl adenosine modification protein (Sua5/YciO/YrdC/YwlC family)